MIDFDTEDNFIIQESPARQLACELLSDSSYTGEKYYKKEDEYTEKIVNFVKPREVTVYTLTNCYDSQDIKIVAVKASQAKEADEIIVSAMKAWNTKVGAYPNGEYGNIFDYIYAMLDEGKIEYNIIASGKQYIVDNECYVDYYEE